MNVCQLGTILNVIAGIAKENVNAVTTMTGITLIITTSVSERMLTVYNLTHSTDNVLYVQKNISYKMANACRNQKTPKIVTMRNKKT